MKIAAYQAPLDVCSSPDIIDVIREQVRHCESADVEILCCPEAVLGGLADYSSRPMSIAIDVEAGQLDETLAPLASDTVTTIIGFTEVDRAGRLYNSAAILCRGSVVGLYRKLYPAINKSVYTAGDATPVFTVGALTFGIVICRDSNFAEPARAMAAKGAMVLMVPTNNGLPPSRGGSEIVIQARQADIARATENDLTVIRADVAGRAGDLVSYGSTSVVDPDGRVVATARALVPELIVADVAVRATTFTTDRLTRCEL